MTMLLRTLPSIGVISLFLAFFVCLVRSHPGHSWDQEGPIELSVKHPALSEKSGVIYLGDNLFTGVLIDETEVTNAKLVASDIPNSILALRYAYKDGIKNGMALTWYENGFMKESFYYSRGLMSGIQQEWHKNGRPKSKKDYIMGVLYGLEQYWDLEGKLIRELVHDPVEKEPKLLLSE